MKACRIKYPFLKSKRRFCMIACFVIPPRDKKKERWKLLHVNCFIHKKLGTRVLLRPPDTICINFTDLIEKNNENVTNLFTWRVTFKYEAGECRRICIRCPRYSRDEPEQPAKRQNLRIWELQAKLTAIIIISNYENSTDFLTPVKTLIKWQTFS